MWELLLYSNGDDIMPTKPKQPCAYLGCPKLSNGRYCEEHRKKVNKDYAWHKLRSKYVQSHPYCEKCLEQGKLAPVKDVHHIVPLSRGGKNEMSNLMSLCHSCHEKIHVELGDRNVK